MRSNLDLLRIWLTTHGTSAKKYSPRRQRSLPPSASRRNSFTGTDASNVPPPPPVVDPVLAAKLAEAKAFQAEVTAPRSPGGRGKSFVPRENFGRHKVISPTASKPLGKLVPFKATSKVSSAPKSVSGRSGPFTAAARNPSASNGGTARQPVSTKFDKNWLHTAGAVLRKTSSAKHSLRSSSGRQSPAPSVRSESARQLARQKAASISSHATDLIVRTASIPEQVPEELFDDIFDLSPRARAHRPLNDSRTVNQSSIRKGNSGSSFGTELNVTTRSVLELPPPVPEETEEELREDSDLLSLCGSSQQEGDSPRGAAQELMELGDMAWILEPDFSLAEQHDDGDMAAVEHAAQRDNLSGGHSSESSMLIDFSSPQRNLTVQSAPAANSSGGNTVVGSFAMPQSLMDDSFEMDRSANSSEGGVDIESAALAKNSHRNRANSLTTTAGCSERIADVDPLSLHLTLLAEATSSNDEEQSFDAGLGEISGQGTSRRIVYAIDEMVGLRGMTSPELVADVVDHMKMARQRAQAEAGHMAVARQRAQAEADQMAMARQRAQAEASHMRKAAKPVKYLDDYRLWGSPYPPPRGGGPNMPEELTTPVKNTIKNELELARKGFTPSRPFPTPVKRAQAYGTPQSSLSLAATSVQREQSSAQKKRIDVSQHRPTPGFVFQTHKRGDYNRYLARNTDRNKSGPASNVDAAKQPAAAKRVPGGLGDSRWASPPKTAASPAAVSAATTTSQSQAATKPAGLRKTSGGLAESRWASPPKKSTTPADDDYSDDESVASHKSHKRSPAVDIGRGRGRTGFPARSIAVDENVSPLQLRSDRGRARFDGADDESPSPPFRRRREPSSPLKSPTKSEEALDDESQDPIVATAGVDAGRPALAIATNRSRANAVTTAGSPKRNYGASVLPLAAVDPSWQHALLADAQTILPLQQPQHGITLASTVNSPRHGISDLSSLKSFQELRNLSQQRQHATHDIVRKLKDQELMDAYQLKEQLDANAIAFSRMAQQPYVVQPLPPVVFAPRGSPPVLQPQGQIADLLEHLSRLQTPILTGRAYVPDDKNPMQVRRGKYILRGTPWIDSSSGTVRANIYLCHENGVYNEAVGIIDGPPGDLNGNLWFADLFTAIDSLSPHEPVSFHGGGFLAPSDIQSAAANQLEHHDGRDPVLTSGYSAMPGAITYTAYQPAPLPRMAPRLAGSVHEYALTTVQSIGSRNRLPSGPVDRSHALRFANPSPPMPAFATARSSPERPPRLPHAIPIRHPEDVPAQAWRQPRPSLTSIFAGSAVVARNQSQSSSTLPVQSAPFVPARTGRPSAAVPIRRPEDVPAQRPSSAGGAWSSAMSRSQSQSSQSSLNLSAPSAPFVLSGYRGPSGVDTTFPHSQASTAQTMRTMPLSVSNTAMNGDSGGDVVVNTAIPTLRPTDGASPLRPSGSSTSHATPSSPAATAVPVLNGDVNGVLAARQDALGHDSSAPRTPPARLAEGVPVRQPRGPPANANNNLAANNFAALAHLPRDDLNYPLPTNLQLIMLSRRQSPQRLLQPIVSSPPILQPVVLPPPPPQRNPQRVLQPIYLPPPEPPQRSPTRVLAPLSPNRMRFDRPPSRVSDREALRSPMRSPTRSPTRLPPGSPSRSPDRGSPRFIL